MSKTVKNFIIIFLVGITFFSVDHLLSLSIGSTGNLVFKYASLILILFAINKFYDIKHDPVLTNVKIYLIWVAICIVRGFFEAEGYWQWKFFIISCIFLLSPICIYIFTNTYLTQKVVKEWFRILLPMFFLFVAFMHPDGVGTYLVPGGFMLLFFPFLSTKWKIIGLGMAAMVLAANLGARSNVLKFLIPFALSLTYYFKFPFSNNMYKGIRLTFLILPFVLLVLGITNVFNVFKMSDYIEGEYRVESRHSSWEGDGDLTVDTRTFLYVEVIASALKYDYVWLGRTPARGNESPHFGPGIDRELGTNRMERHTNEANMLNIFTWTGIVGVVLYFLIFLKATYLALYRSESRIMKIVGIFVAFRWVYGWVEDFSNFNLSFLFIWIMIGMCFSHDFRSMNDYEFKNWVRGMFDSKYHKAILKKTKVSLQKI